MRRLTLELKPCLLADRAPKKIYMAQIIDKGQPDHPIIWAAEGSNPVDVARLATYQLMTFVTEADSKIPPNGSVENPPTHQH